MKQLRLTVLKNASANLIRGGATALVAIALPRFLTQTLDTERFAAWSLILQIAAYASFLDFGLQTAVARFIAQAIELEQKERQAKLISTALTLLSGAGLIAFTLISLVIWQLPHLFHGVGLTLLPELRHAAILLSVSACVQLPLSAYTGVLIGMHRNEIPAMAIGITRIAGALAAIATAHFTQSLAVLALCIAVPNLAGGMIQMAAVHQLLMEGSLRARHVSRVIGNELLRCCAGLTAWSFGMLLVSGLDVTIVGHFQFAAVGFYSIASILISFVAGLSNAALSALMTPVAALHARGEINRIQEIVFSATRFTMLSNCILTAIIFLWGGPLLTAWVGPVYAANALPILEILAVAQTVRLMAAPYAVMLVSIGEQSKGVTGAIAEALLNLVASVMGARLLGPIGVAWGTLIGAIGGLLWMFVRVMPSVKGVHVQAGRFLRRAVLTGSFPCVPLVALWLTQDYLAPMVHSVVLTICVVSTALLGGRASLLPKKS